MSTQSVFGNLSKLPMFMTTPHSASLRDLPKIVVTDDVQVAVEAVTRSPTQAAPNVVVLSSKKAAALKASADRAYNNGLRALYPEEGKQLSLEVAIRLLDYAARNGNADAAEELKATVDPALSNGLKALYPRNGKETSPSVGIRLLDHAARQGSAIAMEKLGSFFEQGKFVQQDFTMAADYYKVAADLGNTRAAHALVGMWSEGKSQPPSDEEALKYKAQSTRYNPPTPAIPGTASPIGPRRRQKMLVSGAALEG